MKKNYFIVLLICLFFSLSTTFSKTISEKDLADVSFDDSETTLDSSKTSNDSETTEKTTGESSNTGSANSSQTSNDSETTENAISESSETATQDADGWDISKLDTARNEPYLTDVEKDVILETNKVRADPAKYAKMYIEPRFKLFEGRYYKEPGKITLVTSEGVSAVKACYNFLLKQQPCEPLLPGKGLSKAAKDHADEQGRTSSTGHNGLNGSYALPMETAKPFVDFRQVFPISKLQNP